ncbi:MAG: AEC family transporter [Kiloniellales bacterium]
MSSVLAAVLPVFLLIFLGYAIRVRGWVAAAFWEPAERLTYFVLFPALLVVTLAGADLSQFAILRMAAVLVISILALSAVLFLAHARSGGDGPAFTSLLQGAIRMNSYIGLAVAFGVHGPAGVAAAALAIAIIVPIVNLLSVGALARYGAGARPTLVGTLEAIVTNPLILAVLAGILLNASGLGLPPIVEPLLEILGRAALPMGLLAVGAGLDFAAARAGRKTIALACALKLVLLPLATALLCDLFDVEGVARFVALLYNATPTATSSYILARQLGGDAKLMAGILTVQTGLAVITLPLALALLA